MVVVVIADVTAITIATAISIDGVDTCDYGIAHGTDKKFQCGSYIKNPRVDSLRVSDR